MTTLEFYLVLAAIGIAIVFLLYFIRNVEGCGGDCYQGRRECNCKGKK